jgi:RNA 2',3'-cyclic 3'-phosphodiesterase
VNVEGVESAQKEPTARLFFALWPDSAMQEALANAVSSIVREADGRAVPQKNFHLTLAFLGSVPESRIEALRTVAEQCSRTLSPRDVPIVITLDTLDHWRKSEILCATAHSTPPAAVALSDALKRALGEAGFTPDLKPFRTHATLVRKVHRVTGDLHIAPVRWTFRDFHLVESRTDRSGSAYSTREKWVLDARDH